MNGHTLTHTDAHARPAGTGKQVEADSKLRALMKDPNASPLKKYMALVFGRESLVGLMWFELRLLLLANIPGALGLVLRKKLYRSMFGSIGRNVVIGKGVTLRHPHRIRIGDNVVIDDHAVLDGKGDREVSIEIGAGSIVGRNSILSCKQQAGERSGRIVLAEQVNISVNCTLLSETELVIGRKVMIAGHVYMIAGGNHGLERVDIPILDQPMTHKGGITIGEGSWVGANAVVLDGVKIGEGAVVAAGAVVNKPVESFIIVAGVPAKPIRDRRAYAATQGIGLGDRAAS